LIFLDARFGVGIVDKVIRPAFVDAGHQRSVDVHLEASVVGVAIAWNWEEIRRWTPR